MQDPTHGNEKNLKISFWFIALDPTDTMQVMLNKKPYLASACLHCLSDNHYTIP